MSSRKTICVGITAYNGLDNGQVAEDYLRLMYHFGRRCQEYDFQLALKYKSEQFRARNAIVKAAIQHGADYIFMLDDDHIFDVENGQLPTDLYNLPMRLVKHLEDNPAIGVVGALYYQRGGDCYPVVMYERPDGIPHFIHPSEVAGRMQQVSTTGGGCMMIRTAVFDHIAEPWFAPEHEFGTDIQLCKQIRAAGYEVWCDTSQEVGHLLREHSIITSKKVRGIWKMKAEEVHV